ATRIWFTVSGDQTTSSVFSRSPFQPVAYNVWDCCCRSGTSLLKYAWSVEANETFSPLGWSDQRRGSLGESNVYSGCKWNGGTRSLAGSRHARWTPSWP